MSELKRHPFDDGFLPLAAAKYTRPTGERVTFYRAGRTVVVCINEIEVLREVLPLDQPNPWLWAETYKQMDQEAYEAQYEREFGAQ